jgi:hypothetical protein
MPASSEVQICSNALLLIGSRTISSFTEDGDPALIASNLWPTVRDAVLRSHPWNCAMKRAALAADAVAPDFDWSFRFQLPGDCLRMWTVGRSDEAPEWQIENGFILMDDAICYARYIQQLTDVTKYDSLLTLAMTSGMAAVLAYPITKSQSQQDAMVKLHEFHLKTARTVDGQEGTGEQANEVAQLIAARGRS